MTGLYHPSGTEWIYWEMGWGTGGSNLTFASPILHVTLGTQTSLTLSAGRRPGSLEQQN